MAPAGPEVARYRARPIDRPVADGTLTVGYFPSGRGAWSKAAGSI